MRLLTVGFTLLDTFRPGASFASPPLTPLHRWILVQGRGVRPGQGDDPGRCDRSARSSAPMLLP